MTDIYDLVGIGYGPANISLAAAFDELEDPPSALFLERDVDPRWQKDMLLPGSDVQHNPIRDLVSLRNPRSRYSFINYLFEHGRLLHHLNLPTVFPLRTEYTDYIDWVRRTVPAQVRYGADVQEVTTSARVPGGYDIRLADGDVISARAVSLGPGRTPHVPVELQGLPEERVFHLTRYLSSIERYRTAANPRFVIVGGSQSAVELALDLTDRFPTGTVAIVTRTWSLRAKDHSPFSEEIYFPSFTDYYFRSTEEHRRRLDAFTRPTNYSAADLDVLDRLYLRIYEQRFLGQPRIEIYGDAHITAVVEQDEHVLVSLASNGDGAATSIAADAVILATGFRDMGKGENQEPHHPLLGSVARNFAWTEGGYLDVAADYSLCPVQGGMGPIFLNGLCESTHGIGDAGSFSLLSIRAETITGSLLTYLDQLRLAASIPSQPEAPEAGNVVHAY